MLLGRRNSMNGGVRTETYSKMLDHALGENRLLQWMREGVKGKTSVHGDGTPQLRVLARL